MCRGCDIRTRLMVAASAEMDAIARDGAEALANGHAGGQAEALDALLPRIRAVAVQLAGPTIRAKAPPAPPAEEAPAEPAPQPTPEPQTQGFTHAARSAEAMERTAA